MPHQINARFFLRCKRSYNFSITFFIVATTFSLVKPNFLKRVAAGADAPKPFMVTVAPSTISQNRCNPSRSPTRSESQIQHLSPSAYVCGLKLRARHPLKGDATLASQPLVFVSQPPRLFRYRLTLGYRRRYDSKKPPMLSRFTPPITTANCHNRSFYTTATHLFELG